MRYRIRLTIDYSYQAASEHVRNLLRLIPVDGPNQRVTEARLLIEPPPDERRDGRDFFGNAVSAVVWYAPVQQLVFSLDARAERHAAPVVDLSPPLESLSGALAVADIGPGSPQHFLAASPRIAAHPAISAFARAAVPAGVSALEAVQAVGGALFRAMTYDTEATDVNTAPADAFAARNGVCQDFSQIMIAGLRALGVPAGYVSGFLRTYPPPGQPRLAGIDAMHAWVAAWVGPAHGWVEFDPTNDQWAGEDYITVAIGRDYADTAPVKGALRSVGGHSGGQAVDVIPLD
jgi:transglutaminase-like putative cysteine protease